jgi:hypothetical protein
MLQILQGLILDFSEFLIVALAAIGLVTVYTVQKFRRP